MGITLKSSSKELNVLGDTFRHYAEWYTDAHPDANAAELFVDQGRKFATDLFVATADIAPTKAEITADVEAQGWKIPREFADGRIGRGVPAQWLGWILSKREKRRGRPSKGQSAGDDEFMRQRPTLAQMQRFVIDMRSAARKYLASGWLGSIVDLGGTPKASSGKVEHERGGAEIRHTPGRTEIVLWNNTPGIETMNEQKQFVAKAITVRAADMFVYIRRKMDEAARRYFRAG